jgi:hypothetical protein
MQAQIITNANSLVGHFKTFGYFGPVYEVLSLSVDKSTVHVKVVTSGEESDYPLTQALNDPEA